MDPPDDDVLRQPPRDPDEPMLGRPQWNFHCHDGPPASDRHARRIPLGIECPCLIEARNLAFSVLVFGELFRAFAARSTTRLFWEVGAFTNLRLLGVVVFSVVMQLGIHHIPAAQALFEIGPLSVADCALTLAVAHGPVTCLELWKLVRRTRARARPSEPR